MEGGWGGQCTIRGNTHFMVVTKDDGDNHDDDSESLEEILELADELRVDALHEAGEALVAQQRLLGLQLLVDKLLQGDAVHRVLQGQLQRDRKSRQEVALHQETHQALLLHRETFWDHY